jgi:hypothetical protein
MDKTSFLPVQQVVYLATGQKSWSFVLHDAKTELVESP